MLYHTGPIPDALFESCSIQSLINGLTEQQKSYADGFLERCHEDFEMAYIAPSQTTIHVL